MTPIAGRGATRSASEPQHVAYELRSAASQDAIGHVREAARLVRTAVRSGRDAVRLVRTAIRGGRDAVRLVRTATCKAWDALRCLRAATRSGRDAARRLRSGTDGGRETTERLHDEIGIANNAIQSDWIAIHAGQDASGSLQAWIDRRQIASPRLRTEDEPLPFSGPGSGDSSR